MPVGTFTGIQSVDDYVNIGGATTYYAVWVTSEHTPPGLYVHANAPNFGIFMSTDLEKAREFLKEMRIKVPTAHYEIHRITSIKSRMINE